MMTEPVSTGSGLTAAAVGAGALGWFAGLDPGTVIGAFAGAVFFVVSSTELTRLARFGYGFVSLIFGIVCAQWFAELLSWVVGAVVPNEHSRAPVPLGALVAAAMAIRMLLGLSTANFSNAIVSRLFSGLQSAVVKPKNEEQE